MCNEEAGDISESMLEVHNILLMYQEDVGDTDFSATETCRNWSFISQLLCLYW